MELQRVGHDLATEQFHTQSLHDLRPPPTDPTMVEAIAPKIPMEVYPGRRLAGGGRPGPFLREISGQVVLRTPASEY